MIFAGFPARVKSGMPGCAPRMRFSARGLVRGALFACKAGGICLHVAFTAMDAENVKNYFCKTEVVCDYARAVTRVGLWESEKLVFGKYLEPGWRVLELGCGAGRIAHGLSLIGFGNVVGTDFSPAMVEVARAIAADSGGCAEFRVEDATGLSFADSSFDAAVFGFNGIMQIPLRRRRRLAMSEAARVLRPGGIFIFTTHDRDAPRNAAYWRAERESWAEGTQHSALDEFGDICYESGCGELFIHSPSRAEVREDASSAGFGILLEKKRSEIAFEPQTVREFSDECVFWVCQKK